MKAKRLLLVLLTVSMLLGSAGIASAVDCSASGKVAYVYVNSAGVTYVYLRPASATPLAIYYFFTLPPTPGGIAMRELVYGALASNNNVYINSSLTACPTSGTIRPYGTPYVVRVIN